MFGFAVKRIVNIKFPNKRPGNCQQERIICSFESRQSSVNKEDSQKLDDIFNDKEKITESIKKKVTQFYLLGALIFRGNLQF